MFPIRPIETGLAEDPFFAKYLSTDGQAINDISVIADKLPKNLNDIRSLIAWCGAAELAAAFESKHSEVKRFNDLAMQLEHLADKM